MYLAILLFFYFGIKCTVELLVLRWQYSGVFRIVLKGMVKYKKNYQSKKLPSYNINVTWRSLWLLFSVHIQLHKLKTDCFGVVQCG